MQNFEKWRQVDVKSSRLCSEGQVSRVVSNHLNSRLFSGRDRTQQDHFLISWPTKHYCINRCPFGCVPDLRVLGSTVILIKEPLSVILQPYSTFLQTWNFQGVVPYIASPCAPSQDPICLSLSSKTGMMVPCFDGPTLTKMFPPQLTVIAIYWQ